MCYTVCTNKRKERPMENVYKIAAALGAISFFILWGFLLLALFNQDWPQVTALAALHCAIRASVRPK